MTKKELIKDKIWTVENFLSIQECNQFINFSEQLGFKEATVSLPEGAKIMKGIRNNERVLHTNTDLAQKLWSKLKPFCPSQLHDFKAIGLNEQFRIYKYKTDQRFKRHIDGSYVRSNNEKSFITVLVYLNDEFKGGETSFDNIDIIPKTGHALCFLHAQKHEGKVIEHGVKYVLRTDIMYQKA